MWAQGLWIVISRIGRKFDRGFLGGWSLTGVGGANVGGGLWIAVRDEYIFIRKELLETKCPNSGWKRGELGCFSAVLGFSLIVNRCWTRKTRFICSKQPEDNKRLIFRGNLYSGAKCNSGRVVRAATQSLESCYGGGDVRTGEGPTVSLGCWKQGTLYSSGLDLLFLLFFSFMA